MPLIKNPSPAQINSITFAKTEPAPGVEVSSVVAKVEAPTVDKKMSSADWAAKDRRISRQGLFQAALQSPALMQYAPSLEEYLELVKKVADMGLEYVNA